MSIRIMLACAMIVAAEGFLAKAGEECPIDQNIRGHENIEWSTSYAFHLTDEDKNLPRVLLVGDSICYGYQERVRNLTKGLCNISYWVSSYCVTSPEYLRLLDFHLTTEKYAVIHFNNGLHSLQTDIPAWSDALRKALRQIQIRQPHARIVWAASTPLADDCKTMKVRELNRTASAVVEELGGIETNDLFSLLDPLDRKSNWRDVYHHGPEAVELEARQVARVICPQSNGSMMEKRVESPARIWNRERYYKTPKTWSWAEPFSGEVVPLWMEGAPYRGNSTRCFAFFGKPEYASATNKVPGIVLMHGGAGTAYPEWVRLWVKRGYAAICVDNCGAMPVRMDDGSWMRSPFGGPSGWGRFDAVRDPIEDQWLYHAVAAGMLAQSYLRSLDYVDVSCIGVTGISWGGVITCIMAAVDNRFAYAVPVYGCGFNDAEGGVAWNVENAREWVGLWDPRKYLPFAKCPFLWVDGTNDHGFSLDSVMQSADLVQGGSQFCTRLRMKHAHGAPGEAPAEILAFADHYARGGKDIVRVTSTELRGGELIVKYAANGRNLVRADLLWDVDGDDVRFPDRRWDMRTIANFDAASGFVRVHLPEDATEAFVNLVDDDGLIFSSRVVRTSLFATTAL